MQESFDLNQGDAYYSEALGLTSLLEVHLLNLNCLFQGFNYDIGSVGYELVYLFLILVICYIAGRRYFLVRIFKPHSKPLAFHLGSPFSFLSRDTR